MIKRLWKVFNVCFFYIVVFIFSLPFIGFDLFRYIFTGGTKKTMIKAPSFMEKWNTYISKFK